jgi:hypothetical protein
MQNNKIEKCTPGKISPLEFDRGESQDHIIDEGLRGTYGLGHLLEARRVERPRPGISIQ